jgi:hypothetical protein
MVIKVILFQFYKINYLNYDKYILVVLTNGLNDRQVSKK